jgi:hypothetical protein
LLSVLSGFAFPRRPQTAELPPPAGGESPNPHTARKNASRTANPVGRSILPRGVSKSPKTPKAFSLAVGAVGIAEIPPRGCTAVSHHGQKVNGGREAAVHLDRLLFVRWCDIRKGGAPMAIYARRRPPRRSAAELSHGGAFR